MDYAKKVEAAFMLAGFRVEADYRPEKIGAKIRDAQLELIPYMFVIGGKEVEAGPVSLRDRIDGDLGAMPLAAAIEKLQTEVRDRTVRQKFQQAEPVAVARGERHEY